MVAHSNAEQSQHVINMDAHVMECSKHQLNTKRMAATTDASKLKRINKRDREGHTECSGLEK